MTFSREERFGLALLLIIFTYFTWRGLTMFYSGDDMMNMYGAWDINPWRLARAQLMLWMPAYRPVGGAIYRLFYTAFGFRPEPLYGFCWALSAANVIFAYVFFRAFAGTVAEALTALALVLVHGSFRDIYYSAGTIYDRLCFLFTVTGLVAYIKFRRQPGWQSFTLICLLSVLAMGSKESGIALFPLILCCEGIMFFGPVLKGRAIGMWLRQVAPLFITLFLLSLVFILGRVNRTPGLRTNPSYIPSASVSIWLTNVGSYLSGLAYHRAPFSKAVVVFLLASMMAAGIVTRSLAMLFGLLFFVISVTPVALIPGRAGYVLYVPVLGLGLFFAATITLLIAPLTRLLPQAGTIAFLLVTGVLTWVHIRNWPLPPDRQSSPEWRLTEQFRRDYPTFSPNSKLLFVSDDFPVPAWDLLFNLRLLYHDKSMIADRLNGIPEQKPNRDLSAYDHIFAAEGGQYVELDRRNPVESIQLNILRDYTVAHEMDLSRRDHTAYVVWGLKDGGSHEPSRWTSPRAKFKFALCAAPAFFRTQFYVPGFVAGPAGRTLSILVNGKELGSVALTSEGMREISFPVPANLTRAEGYTFVEMNVANPYVDANGAGYGIILLRAGFD